MDHISLEIGFGIGFFLGPLVYYIFKKIWKGTRCTWVARQLTAIDFIADLHRIDMAIADWHTKHPLGTITYNERREYAALRDERLGAFLLMQGELNRPIPWELLEEDIDRLDTEHW